MPVIVAEKPKVAKKIAQFLSSGKYKTLRYRKGVYYYAFSLNEKKYFVISGLGHLYNLRDPSNSWKYPVFEYEWAPAYLEDKIYAKKYYIDLAKRFKSEEEVIVATDFDLEGEVIGYHIVKFAMGKDNAERMVFSAVTPKDILRAFYNRQSSLFFNFVEAGETRHIIDWLYGINLSRALTKAIRRYIRGVTLSIGRVQGPTLKIIYDREKEIEEFVPEEFYVAYIYIEKNGIQLRAKHLLEKFKSRENAKRELSSIENYAIVTKVDRKIEKVSPPHPYNLSDLQQDAYKYYRITPRTTLKIAQRLYEDGYISYPRTDSQKFPPTIDFRYILENLSKTLSYRRFASLLLNQPSLRPNNGKKDDVHPPLHPTGLLPRNLEKQEFLIYDLVVRRFLATFMPPGKITREKVILNGKFYIELNKVLERGWMEVYWRFFEKNFVEVFFAENEKVKVIKKSVQKKKTPPPPRYNPASLVKKMESLNLGTKATRAEIVNILFKRGYLQGRSIKITNLGKSVIEVFEKYIPEIISVDMTRKLEEDLERIKNGKKTREEVISEAKEILSNVLSDIKSKEDEIGKALYNAIKLEIKKSEKKKRR